MAFITLSDGLKRYYDEAGPADGPVILLFHGWCASSRLYCEQMPALTAAGYRVFAIDAIGHGRSDKVFVSVSPEKLQDDIYETVDRLGLWKKPLTIIGHSAGGGVAQFMYFRWPEKIAALVLLNTGFTMSDSLVRRFFWSLGPIYARVVFSEPARRAIQPLAGAFMEGLAKLAGKDPVCARAWAEEVFETPGNVAVAEIEEIIKYNTEDRLPTIRVPVCIIGGTLDPLAPPRQSRRMHELIPDSELHMLPGEHTLKYWMSDRVNDIILNFLARAYPIPPKESKPHAGAKNKANRKAAKPSSSAKPKRKPKKESAKRKPSKARARVKSGNHAPKKISPRKPIKKTSKCKASPKRKSPPKRHVQ